MRGMQGVIRNEGLEGIRLDMVIKKHDNCYFSLCSP